MSALVSCSAAGGGVSRLLAYVKEQKKKPVNVPSVTGFSEMSYKAQVILRGFFGEVKKNHSHPEKKFARMDQDGPDGSVWYRST